MPLDGDSFSAPASGRTPSRRRHRTSATIHRIGPVVRSNRRRQSTVVGTVPPDHARSRQFCSAAQRIAVDLRSPSKTRRYLSKSSPVLPSSARSPEGVDITVDGAQALAATSTHRHDRTLQYPRTDQLRMWVGAVPMIARRTERPATTNEFNLAQDRRQKHLPKLVVFALPDTIHDTIAPSAER